MGRWLWVLSSKVKPAGHALETSPRNSPMKTPRHVPEVCIRCSSDMIKAEHLRSPRHDLEVIRIYIYPVVYFVLVMPAGIIETTNANDMTLQQ